MSTSGEQGPGYETYSLLQGSGAPRSVARSATETEQQFRGMPIVPDRYVVEKMQYLGEGEYAVVYRVPCRDLAGRPVVVKLFKRSIPDDQKERALREVLLVQKILSRHVVKIITPFFRDPVSWIEMEFFDGVSLAKRMKAGEPLPFEEVRAIGVGLFEGLKAAHAAGVVHRDIKPENLLVPRDPGADSQGPAVVISDFGIAKAIEEQNSTNNTAVWPGTPCYAPPEVFLGEKVGPSGDIYSASVALYEAATGRFPWPAIKNDDWARLTPQHQFGRLYGVHMGAKGAPVPASSLVAVPRTLDVLLARGLSRDPHDRPTPDDFISALQTASSNPADWGEQELEGAVRQQPKAAVVANPGLAPAASASVPPARPARSARPVLVGGALLAVAGLATALFMGGNPLATQVATEPQASGIVPPVTTPPSTLASPAATGRLRAMFDLGDVTVQNVSGSSLSALKLAVVTADGVTHHAEWQDPLEAGESVYLWSARWSPPLPESPMPESVRVEATTAGGTVTETVAVVPEPAQ